MVKMIASGMVGKATEEKSVYATVYVELDEAGVETEVKHYVVKYKEVKAEAATDALALADMASGTVPGVNGHEDEELVAEATEVRYMKTRMVKEGKKFVVYGAARYIK